jgi:hypothetical protein
LHDEIEWDVNDNKNCPIAFANQVIKKYYFCFYIKKSCERFESSDSIRSSDFAISEQLPEGTVDLSLTPASTPY